MSAGYTSFIQNGDVTTGEDFLKLCTGAFFVDMINESLSTLVFTYFEPNPYYKKHYDEMVETRNKYKQMTFDEAKQEMIDDHEKKVKEKKQILDKCILEDDRCMKVRVEIEKWVPPTPKHEDLKKFALEQIDLSLHTHSREQYEKDLNREKWSVSDAAVWEYLNKRNKIFEKAVKDAYEQWQKELQRTDEKNAWMRQFLDSLESA